MADRTVYRLNDIIDAIDAIHSLLVGKTFEDMIADRVTKAAFERFLEILSEASRHIPETLRARAPQVPWRRVGDIGNHLRHAYQRVDAGILWDLYASGELADLQTVAIDLRSILDTHRES
jgi:uncharacterized protein with HEPN domain